MTTSFRFVYLLVASNVASFVITSAAVFLAWSGFPPLALKDYSSTDLAVADSGVSQSLRFLQTQECCTCTPQPTPRPTSSPLVSSSTFDCPSTVGPTGSIDFSNDGPINFNVPDSNNLCTLVQVSPDGNYFKPVGRSYAGNDWEATSGEFSTLTWSCSGSSCIVDLPTLPAGAVYQLTSFDAPTLVRGGADEVARFLEQATFGPTRADIAKFDVSNLPQAFAKWIKDQQVTVPLTSHRAMFRQRTNSRMETATHQGAVTHPCQKGTRYRRYAFSSKDRSKYVDVKTVGNKRIVSIDGFVRTVVNGPISNFYDSSMVWPDGSYQMGSSPDMDALGGSIYMYLEAAQGNAAASFNGDYGNPLIDLDSSIGAAPNILIQLSTSNAVPVDSQYFQKSSVKDQEITLTRDLSDTVCQSLKEPGNPINPVFAQYKGVYWIHDPRFDTLSNTVETPAPDGGGKVTRQTFNLVQPEQTAICANAPRTFLNENTCKLSNDPTACTAESYDPTGGSFRPNFYVTVNPETMRGIYDATGGGAEGTRYLYAIDGLRIDEDRSIGFPCEREKSRWIPIECTGAAASLDPTVHEIFSKMLLYNSDPNPLVRDIWNWYELECPTPLMRLTGFEVLDQDGVRCWKNVHPDYMSVFDMTYWTRLDSHPGNSLVRNPIKEFAQAGKTTLDFPSWHGMERWADHKYDFGYVGRLGDVVHYYDLPSSLRSQVLNDYFGFTPDSVQYTDSKGVLVCGSPFEVANDLSLGGSQSRGAFDSNNPPFTTTDAVDLTKQKRIIWTEVALWAKDQLRQRVAWALSQILVVSPKAIDDGELITESMTLYYDIFVRNAFGSYRDILKEVSYSVVMSQMLTYYGSRSTAYTWISSENLEFADENYAREIMQLFTIGMFKLNVDGSQVIGDNGDPIRAYTNDDIVEYARVWTGFEARTLRGNIEAIYNFNRVDPLRINMQTRDVFPKMGLDRKYIGDGVPLCADLPDKHFLKAGATYRLLGADPTPDLLQDPKEWASDTHAERLTLQSNGANSLFAKLCGSQSASSCTMKAKVVLDTTLSCSGKECSVETVRVVEVGKGVFYEYVRPPCVFQGFFQNAKMVVRRREWWDLTCADPRTQVASAACCPLGSDTGEWNDMYWGERTAFAAAETRCSKQLCNRWPRPNCDAESDPSIGTYCSSNAYFWTDTTCTLRAKINNDGTVAVVHSPDEIEPQAITRLVQNDTKTYFRVDWSSPADPKTVISKCSTINSCSLALDNVCVCDVSVTDEQVFFEGDTLSPEKVLSTLHIGAFDPKMIGSTFTSKSINGVTSYTLNGRLSASSIFEVTDANNVRQFRKNLKSTVQIKGSAASFRNPVHFISLTDAELHQAQDETDAALDHYFYHSNTAPFLALRFAQRFGVSNPSPGYITRISQAFRSGSYTYTGGGSPVTYGSGKYGDLSAMVACVLLDREARTLQLDADPAHGSLKEPLIKVIGLMRSLEFTKSTSAGFVDLDIDVNRKIGQMAYAIPNVFSFFLPEYKPSGPVSLASLVAPEAQVITGPRTIDFLNGVFSLIKYGLSPCLGGFGRYQWWENPRCWEYSIGGVNNLNLGKLMYSPSDTTSSEAITDELATLLTSGRLSASHRALIDNVVAAEPNKAMATMKAQQLISLTPEFHATNIARSSGSSRPEPESPKPSTKPYKAVVYVLLDGGMDSFNMLVPHTCTTKNSDGKTVLEQYLDERTSLAVTEEERSRVINAVGQPCSQFVVHQDLAIVERLYKDGDLSFFANAGVINRPVNKKNYYELTKTALFGHNTMQDEAQKIDPFDGAPGTGILGRMCDALKRKGFNAKPITVQDATIATIGVPGAATDPLFVSPYETNEFNPSTDGETFKLRQYLNELNDATELQSSVFGETWSQRLQTALFDNEAILKALSSTQLKNTFSDTEYSSKLRAVATLIASHNLRGTDRDVFYLSMGGWDHHQGMKAGLSQNFVQLNEALTTFTTEMKAQGEWQGVTLVITSDFSRTLTANSGEGSDHAWGGNYFMMGGAVKGGKILGTYPSDITIAGPQNIGRGRFIPTLSWESIMNPIVEWMGADSDADLDYCLPNRKQTGAKLFKASEVFDSSARSFWS